MYLVMRILIAEKVVGGEILGIYSARERQRGGVELIANLERPVLGPY